MRCSARARHACTGPPRGAPSRRRPMHPETDLPHAPGPRVRRSGCSLPGTTSPLMRRWRARSGPSATFPMAAPPSMGSRVVWTRCSPSGATTSCRPLPALPGSIYPELVEADVFEDWAWAARGTGAADQVSGQSWLVFAHRAEMAADALRQLGRRSDEDPDWYELSLGVGLDQSLNPEAL